jgi:lipopolysaccharide assembly protein A
MRFVYFLFLLVFLAAVGGFAYFNQQEVSVRFMDWGLTSNVAVVTGVAYVLGMLSGWTVVGMLRRSWHEVVEADGRRYHRTA